MRRELEPEQFKPRSSYSDHCSHSDTQLCALVHCCLLDAETCVHVQYD